MRLVRCDVFEKKIDSIGGSALPPIEIGGFKIIDVFNHTGRINPKLQIAIY
jgi:hypothetical protein